MISEIRLRLYEGKASCASNVGLNHRFKFTPCLLRTILFRLFGLEVEGGRGEKQWVLELLSNSVIMITEAGKTECWAWQETVLTLLHARDKEDLLTGKDEALRKQMEDLMEPTQEAAQASFAKGG